MWRKEMETSVHDEEEKERRKKKKKQNRKKERKGNINNFRCSELFDVSVRFWSPAHPNPIRRSQEFMELKRSESLSIF
jgi:hypothetical protein